MLLAETKGGVGHGYLLRESARAKKGPEPPNWGPVLGQNECHPASSDRREARARLSSLPTVSTPGSLGLQRK
jgi:hypothetical protein